MTDTHNTIFRALAEHARDSLITKEREDGTTFLCFDDNSPDWHSHLEQAAHDDELPNDWRYEKMNAMLERLAECENEDARDDAMAEVCDSNVDVYTADRIAWLGANLSRHGYCDDAQSEGLAEDADVIDLIGVGQYQALSTMWSAIVSKLDDIAEAAEDGEHVYRYTAGWHMPGYMPETDPARFLTFEDAREYIEETIDEHGDDDDDEEHVDASIYAGRAEKPFSVQAGQYVYWVEDCGLTIEHDEL